MTTTQPGLTIVHGSPWPTYLAGLGGLFIVAVILLVLVTRRSKD